MAGSKRSGLHGLIGLERRRMICKLVSEQGWVNVSSLSSTLGVGTDTIRHDLDKLAEEGLIIRSHGGAVAKDAPMLQPAYSETRDTHMPEKSSIGAAAVEYLPLSGCIFISGGSTTYEFITNVPQFAPLQIYTHSMRVADYLLTHGVDTVHFPGGAVTQTSFTSDWSMSTEVLSELYWDVAFMGAPAIDITRGISEIDRQSAQNSKILMEHSGRVIMLCDSSKLGRVSHAVIGPVTLIDVLITDVGADPDFVDAMKKHGVKVVVADH